MWSMKFGFVVLWMTISIHQLNADEIHIAVASNFTNTIKDIAEHFQIHTGHKVIPIFGSTGKHYAQIKNGAPFDIFFAADMKHPKLLEQQGIGQKGSRFTYAIGKVVLWNPDIHLIDSEGNILRSRTFHHLALANPQLAPYGKAAEQIMRQRNLWNELKDKMVFGENISQTHQFVNSGNAELGFVAYSQIKSPNKKTRGSWWEPSQSLYDPIEQQVLLLKDNAVAREFLHYMKSDEVRKLIQGYGYGTL